MAATSVITVLLGRNELAPVCIGLDGWVLVAVLLLFTIDRDTSVWVMPLAAGYGGGWPMADSRESGGITHHHRIQRLSRPDDRRRPLAR